MSLKATSWAHSFFHGRAGLRGSYLAALLLVVPGEAYVESTHSTSPDAAPRMHWDSGPGIRVVGGSNSAAYAIAVDSHGSIYVAGETSQSRSQGDRGGKLDSSVNAFFTKLKSDGRTVVFTKIFGGSGDDIASGVAIDRDGNVYVTGDTSSPDFPVLGGVQSSLASAPDAFVTKFDSLGRLVYSTYLGGAGGDRAMGIGVDSVGQAYVAGYTHSTDFPVAHPYQPTFAGGNADAFIAKLSRDGSKLLYSTYFGGGNDRPDIATAIAVSPAGNAYVTGFTNSRDFPVVRPLQPFAGPTDVFVARLDENGTPVFSTFVGGNADDEAMALAIDNEGDVYVTGETESVAFPTTPNSFSTKCKAVATRGPMQFICEGGDVFVLKIQADGSRLVYSTLLRGNGFDVGRAIVAAADGGVFISGLTGSPDFPDGKHTVGKFNGGQYDAFLVELSSDGTSVSDAMFIGGSDDECGCAITLDEKGNPILAGYTSSPDFAWSRNAYSRTPIPPRGSRAAFIKRFRR